MASFNRPTRATYTINESVTVDTTDNEDHTFSGVVFPVQCKDILPVNHIIINTISVRGQLGPLTVWVTNEGNVTNARSAVVPQNRPNTYRQHVPDTIRTGTEPSMSSTLIMQERLWTKIYEKKHTPSFRQYCELDLSENPILLKPGEVKGIYVHSSVDNDCGIVYDNQKSLKTHDDNFITILPGCSHVSTTPFGTRPIWGWGNAWREHREFVGQISYGVVYDLWNPSEHLRFGNSFRHLATNLFYCQRFRQSPLSRLPEECIFYILNMCRWDWAKDTFDGVRGHQRKMRRLRLQQQQEQEQNAQADVDGNNNEGEVAEVEMQEGGNEEIDSNDGVDESDDSYDESYDEDYAEEDDDEIMSVDNDDSGRFSITVYDDCESSGDEEDREALRLEAQAESRRRWLGRAHVLHHWIGVGDGQDSD